MEARKPCSPLCLACCHGVRQQGAREARPWQDFLQGALSFVTCPGFLCHGREWRMSRVAGMLCVQPCFPQLCCLQPPHHWCQSTAGCFGADRAPVTSKSHQIPWGSSLCQKHWCVRVTSSPEHLWGHLWRACVSGRVRGEGCVPPATPVVPTSCVYPCLTSLGRELPPAWLSEMGTKPPTPWENMAGRVVRYWHRLLREVVDAPRLEIFKARLDEAWSNLV